MEDQFNYPPEVYDQFIEAGVAPLDVDFVLRHSRPSVRRFIGSVLWLTARDRRGHWLVVTCMEGAIDNRFDVVGARYLNDTEVHAVNKILGGQQ